MKKTLLALLLCPVIALAQSKSEWTYFGPNFLYEKENFVDKGFNAAGITDFVITPTGTMVIGSTDFPIFFYQNGKDYGTEKFVFTKEGGKFQLVKGGETKDASGLLIDKNGNLWFGSRKGLQRMDAANFADLDKMKDMPMIEGTRLSPETPGMPFNLVKLLQLDNAGNIWAAGMSKLEHKGLSKYDGNAWTNYMVTGFEGKEIKMMAFDQSNNPIAVSQTGLANTTINWYKDGAWKALGTPGGKMDMTTAVAFYNNTVYTSTVTDIYAWKNEKWEKVALKGMIGSINHMAVDKNNNLWVGTSAGALCINPGGGEYMLLPSNSPMQANVKKVVVDDQNRKWFVTDIAIVAFKEPADLSNDKMTVYNKFNSSFPDGKIEAMMSYKEGMMMSNADRGLVNFDGKSFNLLTNIPETYYSNVVQDKNGTVYLGTYRYMHKYDGTGYTKWEWKDDVGRQVNHVMVDNQNNLWMAFNGVSKFDGTTWQNFNKKNAGLSSNTALKLFQDSKNNIWAALSDGVAKYDGTAWTVFTKKTAGVPLGNMNGIAETKDGKMWFSNGYKLNEFDGTSFKEVAGFKEAGTLRNMIVANDGTLLVATEENGLVKFKDGVQTVCNTQTCGLPTNAISQVFQDKNGKLWVAFGLPPAVERPSFGAMGQQGAQPQAAPVENPKDTFTKKIKTFDSVYGIMELKKF